MSRAWGLIVLAVLFSGCEKEEDGPLDVDTVVDHAYFMPSFAPVVPWLLALDPGPGHWPDVGAVDCAVLDSISGDTTDFPNSGPVTMYLRYPPGGCMALDGRSREGTLVVRLDERTTVTDGEFTITCEDHRFGSLRARFRLHGTTLDSTRWVVMLDSSAMFSSGAWSPRSSGTLVYELSDEGLPSVAGDEVFTLEHDLLGSDRMGRPFHAFTVQPLGLLSGCGWLDSGLERIEPDQLSSRDLDHGSGACDGQATIQVEGQEIGLTIP